MSFVRHLLQFVHFSVFLVLDWFSAVAMRCYWVFVFDLILMLFSRFVAMQFCSAFNLNFVTRLWS